MQINDRKMKVHHCLHSYVAPQFMTSLLVPAGVFSDDHIGVLQSKFCLKLYNELSTCFFSSCTVD